MTTSPYRYVGSFNSMPVDITFDIDMNNVAMSASGFINFIPINGTIPLGTVHGNDNMFARLNSAPYFSSNGVGIFCQSQYYVFLDGAMLDYVFVYNVNDIITPVSMTPLTNESLTLSCLLEGTMLWSPGRFVAVEDIRVGDILMSDIGQEQVVTLVQKNSYSINSELALPFLLPKDAISLNVPDRDLYLTQHHLIKYNNEWKHPDELGATKQTREQMVEYLSQRQTVVEETSGEEQQPLLLTYYHFQVNDIVTKPNLDVNIVANGVSVETYYERA